MANLNHHATKLILSEGLFANDPIDRGGPTHIGITLSAWRKIGYDKDGDSDIDIDDICLVKPEDAMLALEKCYRETWNADEIKNQSLSKACHTTRKANNGQLKHCLRVI